MKDENSKLLLLVEDEALIALSKKKDLETYGYKVLIANSGEKAVSTAKENNNIDLILLDIDLGRGIDGTIAAELILKERELPIVFLSSHTEPEIVEKTEKITSYGYVVKNSSITVLDASIKMAFKLFEASTKLLQSRNDYQDLFNNATDAIYIQDKKGCFLDVNQGAVEMYGYSKEYFLGKTPKFLSAPGKNDLEKLSQIIENAYNGTSCEYDFWGIRKNGKVFPKLVRTQSGNYMGRKVIITHAIDITKRKEEERLLIESDEKYRAIISASPDTITVTDMEGRIQLISPNVLSMLGGKNEEEYMGRSVLDFIVNEDRKRAKQNIALMSESPIHNSEKYKGLRIDGSIFEMDIKGSFIFDSTGFPYQMIFIVRDLSKR